MISTIFDELAKLDAAYTEEIISARETFVPEDSAIMQAFLQAAMTFRQEYQALQQQARELYAKFNF